MEVGEAYVSLTKKTIIVRINRSDNFRVEFYTIPISHLKKLLEEEGHKLQFLG